MAAKLGCTVNELLQRISSKELSEWWAYNQIDPFTEDRADKRSAIIARVNATGLLKSTYSTNYFMAVPKPVQQMDFEMIAKILRGTVSQ